VLSFGCNSTLTGYPFETRAVYEAPHSGFRVEVIGSGRVAAGADLSNSGIGVARICPASRSGAFAATLQLRSGSGFVDWEIAGAPSSSGVAAWDWKDSTSSFEACLKKAGYPSLDAAELEETVHAIDGVLAGPKATRVATQTRSIVVISTRIDHVSSKAPPAPSPCGTF
jgi:hypothetical protein